MAFAGRTFGKAGDRRAIAIARRKNFLQLQYDLSEMKTVARFS